MFLLDGKVEAGEGEKGEQRLSVGCGRSCGMWRQGVEQTAESGEAVRTGQGSSESARQLYRYLG